MTLSGNALFPADNPWNQVISAAPVAGNSSTLVSSIGASSALHPDFGTVYQGANIGIPYNVVSGTQPKVQVVVDAYADESDVVPVPIPTSAAIEGDPLPSSQNTGDRHLIVYDKDNNIAYELFNVHRPSETADGKWPADSEAVWDMSRDLFRMPGDTSADAAGLPILPGLVRPDEVLDQGVITHALRFTVPRSDSSYVFPASHQAGVSNASLPRMGERFRLKQDFDISGFSAANRVILQALKDYGMIVADNGSAWYLSGSPSSRWNDDDLHRLSSLVGSNFEAVDLKPVVTGLDRAGGSVAGGTVVTIQGKDFSGTAGQLQVFFGATPATQVSVISDSTIRVTAPAHVAGTVHVTVRTPYGTSATNTADQFTFGAVAASSVVGRQLFYNQSGTASPLRYDGNNLAINSADDGAIATDKVAYRPGDGAATFANISSYSKGINGIMVDIAGPHGTITASDFIFRVGNNNSPSAWATAPAPTDFSVRAGAGLSGSDRVEFVWANGAIQKKWLEVISLAGANTGLAQSATLPAGQADAFFFGNSVGDTGLGDSATLASVDMNDELGVRSHYDQLFHNIPITNIYDFDRDGTVSAIDELIARNNYTKLLTVVRYLNLSNPPAAPQASPALASTTEGVSRTDPDAQTQTALLAEEPEIGRVSDTSNLLQVIPMSLASRTRSWSSTKGRYFDQTGLDDELISLLASSRFRIRA
ncbi:MAG TPA: IPT/TIG domain-containing protein [Pirellulales bacterium]